MEVILRKSATEQGLSKYFTGKPCSKGHVAPRYVKCRGCVACKHGAYYDNRTVKADSRRKYYKDNVDRIREYSRLRYEITKEERVAYSRAWRANNPDKRARQHAKERAMKRNQTPSLSNSQNIEIELLYAEARMLGGKFHVDHIVPLSKGGLHHPDNLQIVLSDYNLRKGNREVQERKYI